MGHNNVERQNGSEKVYSYGRDGTPPNPPSYDRLLAPMSSQELRDELDLGKGTPDYLAAVRAELAGRSVRA